MGVFSANIESIITVSDLVNCPDALVELGFHESVSWSLGMRMQKFIRKTKNHNLILNPTLAKTDGTYHLSIRQFTTSRISTNVVFIQTLNELKNIIDRYEHNEC